jgi:hypothetical protein
VVVAATAGKIEPLTSSSVAQLKKHPQTTSSKKLPGLAMVMQFFHGSCLQQYMCCLISAVILFSLCWGHHKKEFRFWNPLVDLVVHRKTTNPFLVEATNGHNTGFQISAIECSCVKLFNLLFQWVCHAF